MIAKLSEDLEFSRESSFKLFESISLPKAVVQIHFSVDYNYYVDLSKNWNFKTENGVLYASAPIIEFERPNVDFNSLKFIIKQKGLFINEKELVEKLKQNHSQQATQ